MLYTLCFANCKVVWLFQGHVAMKCTLVHYLNGSALVVRKDIWP